VQTNLEDKELSKLVEDLNTTLRVKSRLEKSIGILSNLLIDSIFVTRNSAYNLYQFTPYSISKSAYKTSQNRPTSASRMFHQRPISRKKKNSRFDIDIRTNQSVTKEGNINSMGYLKTESHQKRYKGIKRSYKKHGKGILRCYNNYRIEAECARVQQLRRYAH
jgi:hypothetical protein